MQPALHPPHEVPAGGGQGWAGHPGQQHQPLLGDSAGQGRDGSAAWNSVRGGRCWQVPAQVRGAFCTKCQRGDVWWAGSKAHFPLPSTIPKEQFSLGLGFSGTVEGKGVLLLDPNSAFSLLSPHFSHSHPHFHLCLLLHLRGLAIAAAQGGSLVLPGTICLFAARILLLPPPPSLSLGCYET